MNNLQYLLLIFIYIALGVPLLVLGINCPVIEDLTQFKSKHHGFDFASFMNLNSKGVMVTKIGGLQRLICLAPNSSPPTSQTDVWNNFKTQSKHNQDKIWKLLEKKYTTKPRPDPKGEGNFIELLNNCVKTTQWLVLSRLACVKNYHQFKRVLETVENYESPQNFGTSQPAPGKCLKLGQICKTHNDCCSNNCNMFGVCVAGPQPGPSPRTTKPPPGPSPRTTKPPPHTLPPFHLKSPLPKPAQYAAACKNVDKCETGDTKKESNQFRKLETMSIVIGLILLFMALFRCLKVLANGTNN